MVDAAPRSATQDEIRRHNLARITRHLHANGATTRSDLVALTGLNRSTVGTLVTELTEAGLVREVAGPAGTIGRPSLVAEPIAESVVAMAFEVRVEQTVGALIGLGGKVFHRTIASHRRDRYRPAAAVQQVSAMAHELLQAAPGDATWVGTGISVAGVINRFSGLVRIAPNLEWRDVPVQELLDEAMANQFGDPPATTVGNDADLGALAEVVRGAGRGRQSVLYLTGDVGVGCGIVLAGSGMVDAGGYSGEVGHMVVNPTGLPCHCGARGCWETEIGADAILRAASLDVGASTSQRDVPAIIAAAQAGEPQAIEALQQVARWVDIGLGNLVNILNPEVIVLGGHLQHLMPYLAHGDGPPSALFAAREQARISLPELGEDSTLIGAAEIALDPLLGDPLGTLHRSRSRIAS